MNLEQAVFAEKYRPKTIDDCILTDPVRKQFKDMVQSGSVPHCLMAGAAGTGKCLDPNEEIEVFMSDEIFNKYFSSSSTGK